MQLSACHSRVGVVLLLCLLCITWIQCAFSQLSAPVSHDDHISVDNNKFLQNKAELDHAGIQDEEVSFDTCPQNVELKWSTEVSSSIYATPLITDLYSDGRKDIIVPSFVHYLEVLEADNGAQAVGWPAFHRSTIHASPLMYDVDLDGVQDIMLTTYNGEVLFFKDTGEQLWSAGLSIPRLRVRKHWYKGLNPDPNNRDNSGLGNFGDKQAQADKPPTLPFGEAKRNSSSMDGAPKPVTEHVALQLANYRKKMVEYRDKYGDVALRQLLEETHNVNPTFYGLLMDQLKREGLVGEDGKVHLPKSSPSVGSTTDVGITGITSTARRRLMQVYSGDMQQQQQQQQQQGATGGVEADPQGGLTNEAANSWDVFQDEDQQNEYVADNGDEGPHYQDNQEGDGGGGTNFNDVDGNQGYDDQDMVQDEQAQDGQQGGQQQAGAHVGDQNGWGQQAYDGWGGDADYHELLNNEEQQQLGAHMAYDELGDRYEMDERQQDDDAAQVAERMAAIKQLTDSIDTTSMEEAEDANNAMRYQGVYDYEAQSAERDKVLSRFWKNEDFLQAQHQHDQEYVYVDAHVLTTPNIGDIDADGHEELVIPVSYFFDREYYDHPDHRHELGEDLDLSKYIASGVVVYDLRTRMLKWSQHLDLSTDSTTLKAHAYATPTLADVNRDGQLEVVVGSSMGYLYVLEPIKGEPLPGWPIQMADVQGQALVMDINNDNHIEIVAGDSRGNVAAFRVSGEEVWSRHVKSMISQGATAGDINADGDIEIVFGTSSGHIYAVSGNTGADIKGFPFRTRGRIQAPALITRLLDGPSQHIIVPSFDGYLYMVDGISACADTIDIGETSYSMVLADDLDGNGQLDLVVSTMNGAVYAFATPARYHPLKTWPAQVGINGMIARHDLVGIYATTSSRKPRDVAGDKLQIQVRVIDKRPVVAPNGTLLYGQAAPYNITAILRGVGVKEMASGSQPVIGVADTVATPGLYTLEVPCPRTRSSATVHLEMMDGNGMVLSDDFSLSFHMHFHKLLKWFIAGPLIAMVLGLLAVSKSREAEDEEDNARLSLPQVDARTHAQ